MFVKLWTKENVGEKKKSLIMLTGRDGGCYSGTSSIFVN